MSWCYRFDIMKKSRSQTRLKLASEHGLALMEVVMASVVLGIAIVGIALMFSLARSMVVAQGDTRIAFYLAQAKLENLRALGFAQVPLSPGGSCPGLACYNESGLAFGEDNSQIFSRLTAVDCVTKSNLDPITPPNPCPSPLGLKRITVRVTPSMPQANPVALETVLATP